MGRPFIIAASCGSSFANSRGAPLCCKEEVHHDLSISTAEILHDRVHMLFFRVLRVGSSLCSMLHASPVPSWLSESCSKISMGVWPGSLVCLLSVVSWSCSVSCFAFHSSWVILHGTLWCQSQVGATRTCASFSRNSRMLLLLLSNPVTGLCLSSDMETCMCIFSSRCPQRTFQSLVKLPFPQGVRHRVTSIGGSLSQSQSQSTLSRSHALTLSRSHALTLSRSLAPSLPLS